MDTDQIARLARATTLDEILQRGEPARSQLLQAFNDDGFNDGPVLIRSNDGRPLTVGHNGREVLFPPKGRRVKRELAVNLLLDYGKGGKYYTMDVATGITRDQWKGMSAKQRESYAEHEQAGFTFIERYLTHISDATDDELDDEPAASPGE